MYGKMYYRKHFNSVNLNYPMPNFWNSIDTNNNKLTIYQINMGLCRISLKNNETIVTIFNRFSLISHIYTYRFIN